MTNMFRSLCIILWITLTFPSFLTAQSVPLLSQTELEPYGLKRDWFHQIRIHSVNARVQDILLEGGQLFVTTSDSLLHVFNADTGEWLWSRTVGSRDFQLTEPAVNSRIVAVHNNLEIFLYNRKTGKQLMQIPLTEAAIAPCEMSENYLYVPLANETMLAYVLREVPTPKASDYVDIDPVPARQSETVTDPDLKAIVQKFEDAKDLLRAADPVVPADEDFVLDSRHRIPIRVATFGMVRTKPLLLSQFYTWVLDEEEYPTHEIDRLTHREYIAWVTEQGFLYAARLSFMSEEGMSMVYRVDSAGRTFSMDRTQAVRIDRPGNKDLSSRPARSQPYPPNEQDRDRLLSPDVIVTGGRAANVFAIDARTGAVNWQYPTQGAIEEQIAIIGGDVYTPTSTGIMHALDLGTGRERWIARGIKRFVAASKKRIYVLDQRGRLVALDRRTGATVFVYDIRRFDHCLYNLETDQIFLVTNKGLIQSLRERQFDDEGREQPLRHRLSAAEFTKIVNHAPSPELWWIEEMQEDMQ